MKCTLKFCTRWVSCLLLALASHTLSAQTIHIAHCLAECPAGSPAANDIVVRHLFAASINYQTGLADWVAYRVLPDTVGVASLLPREWQADQLLSQQLAGDVESGPQFVQPDVSNLQDRDYRINEILINPEDRGRLAPMSSFGGTPYWEDLNYLSNMAPIPVDLRLGPWSRLDQEINELAVRSGEVFVVSGPLFRGITPDEVPAANAGGPAAFFKLVATKTGHAAFIFPATAAQHSSFCSQASSLVQLQQLSGLELLPGIQSAERDDIHGLLGCNSIQNSE